MKMKILLKSLLPALALAASTLLCPAQITNVNIGSVANDGTGDPLRLAFQKLNSNFAYITLTYTATNDTRSLNFNNAANTFNGTFLGSMAYANLTGGPVMSGYLTNAMTGGKIWVGNSGNTAALVALSGDATLGNTGALTLANTSQARTDLGLGSAATLASTAFLQPGNNLSEVGNAPTALANLGGASLTASNSFTGGQNFSGGARVVILRGISTGGIGGQPTILFDPTTNTAANQALFIAGSPYTSGAGVAFPYVDTNAAYYSTVTAAGYGVIDQYALQIMSVGTQAIRTDAAGKTILVQNYNEELDACTAESIGNIAHWYASGSTNGDVFGSPFNDGVSGHIYPLSVTTIFQDVGGTNHLVFQQAANEPKGFEYNQDTGKFVIFNPTAGAGLTLANGATLATTNGTTFIKANGTLGNGVAFDSTDSTAVHLDAARIYAATVFSFTGGSSLAGGPLNLAVAADGSGVFYDNSTDFSMQLGCTLAQMAFVKTTQSPTGYPCVAIGGSNSVSAKINYCNSGIDLMASISEPIYTTTTNFTVSITNSTVLLNAATLTVTLPDATSHCKGRIYMIKLIANSTGTIATTSSQHIDSGTSYSLSAQNKYAVVQSDGSQWWVLANN